MARYCNFCHGPANPPQVGKFMHCDKSIVVEHTRIDCFWNHIHSGYQSCDTPVISTHRDGTILTWAEPKPKGLPGLEPL